MEEILTGFRDSKPFQTFCKIFDDKEKISITGFSGSAGSIFTFLIYRIYQKPVLYIAKGENEANLIYEDLINLFPESILITQELPQRLIRLISKNTNPLIVTTPKIFAFRFPDKEEIKETLQIFRVGDTVKRETLLQWLINNGLERVELVSEENEFAVRGSIIDIFPEDYENPVRFEFFGDEIVSLRYFDTLTQRSTSLINEVELIGRLPSLTETPAPYSPILDNYQAQKGSPTAKVVREGAGETRPTTETFFFSDSIIISEVALDENFLIPTRLITINGTNPDFDFQIYPQVNYLGNLTFLKSEIEQSNFRNFVLYSSDYAKERLQYILGPNPIYVKGSLNYGFILPQEQFSVLTEREIYGRQIIKERKRRFKGLPVDDLLSLHKGDYVVHFEYGIGIFEGTKRLKIDNKDHDFITIKYAANDRLYVPVENLSLINRYIGSSDRPPQLNKLSGRAWQFTKQKTFRACLDYAAELLGLYAQRKVLAGFSFSKDSDWQFQLETGFPYQETPDQIKSLSEIKLDMERQTAMDRLVCGDVGYGKTEVALRAAFKAVLDYKQVAVLVPTTILCYQHYNTFKKRLENFPVRVEMLSRLVAPKMRKAIISDLKAGRIDIIIGTHSLLSSKILFKDLGLLIIDEEQKFGVRQKERIKQYKTTVDVLTLTATPIPRTLYLSLVGLRDISTIHSPPLGRKDIKTEVSIWNDDKVRSYILRELNRQGQVFFIHNRIQTMAREKKRLLRLIPDLRIGMSHGRMPEKDLAQVYLDFIEGKYDLLLSTAIIESGIDMPRVNTIIVNRADLFGLSDLHQLRGRVGRSEEQAYALFIIPSEVSEEGRKRVSAILAYSQLGSGFKLALRDMEIRGVGNILGIEQHGHINRVGFNLYQQLLREAVARLKGEEVLIEPELSLDIEAYIPEDFASDAERVAIYKRILSIEDEKEIESLKEELVDRFGKYPETMENLFKIAQVRLLARDSQISKVSLKDGKITIVKGKATEHFLGDIDRLIAGLGTLKESVSNS